MEKLPVEMWLGELAKEQRNTLQQELLSSQQLPTVPAKLKLSSQIVCLSDRIIFTRRIEEVLNDRKYTFLAVKQELVESITKLATSPATFSKLEQRKDQALIIQKIHHRDVVGLLIQSNTRNTSDWEWQTKLRFYSKKNVCEISICDALFEYSFEYQGNEESLVYTTLTDKCYLNLTQAMRFGFGGNPFGPAGTGNMIAFLPVFYI